MKRVCLVSALLVVGCGKPVWGVCPVPDQTARIGVQELLDAGDSGDAATCTATFDDGWLVLLDRALLDQAWERRGVGGVAVVPLGPLLALGEEDDEALWDACRTYMLDQLPLADDDLDAPADPSSPWSVDLLEQVVVGRYPTWALRSGPPSPAMEGEGGIPADVVDAMFALGASLWVEGSIDCEGEVTTFEWALPGPGSWMCPWGHADVAWGGERFARLRLDLSRLFQTSPSGGGSYAPSAFAQADLDDDGHVTSEELEQVPLVGLGFELEPFGTATNLQQLLDERSAGLFSSDVGACSPAPLRAEPAVR